jgi:hypothetical protein
LWRFDSGKFYGDAVVQGLSWCVVKIHEMNITSFVLPGLGFRLVREHLGQMEDLSGEILIDGSSVVVDQSSPSYIFETIPDDGSPQAASGGHVSGCFECSMERF